MNQCQNEKTQRKYISKVMSTLPKDYSKQNGSLTNGSSTAYRNAEEAASNLKGLESYIANTLHSAMHAIRI